MLLFLFMFLTARLQAVLLSTVADSAGHDGWLPEGGAQRKPGCRLRRDRLSNKAES